MAVVAWVCVKFPEFHTQFGFSEVNYGYAYILIGALLGLTQPLMSLFTNWNSRRAEYKADKQAVKEGYGSAMIDALKKLARDNFAHLAPSKINVVLEYSHPPLADRIEAVEKELSNINKEDSDA